MIRRDNSARQHDETISRDRWPYLTNLSSSVYLAIDSYHSITYPYIGFICANCGEPFIMRYKAIIDLDYAWPEPTEADLQKMDIPWLSYKFKLCCPRCHETNEYDYYLDPAITPALAKLNAKGWKTIYSCQGHCSVNESGSRYHNPFEETMTETNSGAYIWIEKDENKEVCKYIPLSEPWGLLSTEEQFIIRCIHDDRNGDGCSHDDLAYRVMVLEEWVNKLPVLPEDGIFRPSLLDNYSETSQ